MSKDQCYVQTLRTLYLYGILLPRNLFIAERSALKRASQWSLKRLIMLSGSWDIGNLVSGDLVITDWSADNSVNTDFFETFLVLFERFFKGFWWPFRLLKLVKYSWGYGPNEVCDTSPWSYVPPEYSTTSWPYHVTWLLKFPCYLYLNPIVCFEILD